MLLEARHHIAAAEAVREQVELRILRRARARRPEARQIDRVGNKEAARAAEGRMTMAAEALIGIMPGAEAVRIGGELRKGRIELAQPVDGISDDRRAFDHHRAFIAGGLELAGTQNAFEERSLLVFGDLGAGGRMIADDRRRRNLGALGLKPAAGILQAPAHAGIALGKTFAGRQAGDAGNEYRGKST